MADIAKTENASRNGDASIPMTNAANGQNSGITAAWTYGKDSGEE
jgi:hypothetical protein